jgi:hypothetical protein
MKFIKEKWEWFVGAILLLIGVFASSKTKNKTREKDLEARLANKEKISVEQIRISDKYHKNELEILSENDALFKKVEKEKLDRIKELSGEQKKLDDYLKKAGLTKK